jgi:tRNA-specific 2-thiouridylase
MSILNKNKTVFVGLSGGVDSSVSAALLKKAGYKVVGVFIRTWQPDFIECNFREDRLDAMRVATYLDIPFLECDAEHEYKKAVADYMISEYREGRTPNPDVMCNREIKFGVFWNFAKTRGADFVATGHYAQIEKNNLKIANDPSKDQAYFLYRLTSKDLEHVIFPIGHLKKTEVRKLAEKFGLPTAIKKDSQGVCMLGDLDLKDFLSHYIPQKPGDVLNENGEVIGNHDGVTFLTLGERHGFTITSKTPNDNRYYIIEKNIENNTITASQNNVLVEHVANNIFMLENCSWVSEMPAVGKKYTAQIRYHGDFLVCSVLEIKDKNIKIEFDFPLRVASGQSIVLYDKKICLGGGIV